MGRVASDSRDQKHDMDTSKFQTGQTYCGRFVGDHNGKFEFRVVCRTPKMVTLEGRGFNGKDNTLLRKRFHITRNYRGVEYVMPFGRTSLAPSLSAEMVEA
jgi:hypothetical protein